MNFFHGGKFNICGNENHLLLHHELRDTFAPVQWQCGSSPHVRGTQSFSTAFTSSIRQATPPAGIWVRTPLLSTTTNAPSDTSRWSFSINRMESRSLMAMGLSGGRRSAIFLLAGCYQCGSNYLRTQKITGSCKIFQQGLRQWNQPFAFCQHQHTHRADHRYTGIRRHSASGFIVHKNAAPKVNCHRNSTCLAGIDFLRKRRKIRRCTQLQLLPGYSLMDKRTLRKIRSSCTLSKHDVRHKHAPENLRQQTNLMKAGKRDQRASIRNDELIQRPPTPAVIPPCRNAQPEFSAHRDGQ